MNKLQRFKKVLFVRHHYSRGEKVRLSNIQVPTKNITIFFFKVLTFEIFLKTLDPEFQDYTQQKND